jgi:hypothetical protein
MLPAEIGGKRPEERQSSRNKQVADDAEGVHIGCRGGVLQTPLLWGGKLPGEPVLVRLCGGGGIGVSRDAEVGQTPRLIEVQNVWRFEIAVHKLTVNIRQCIGHVTQDGQQSIHAERRWMLLEVANETHVGPRHHDHPLVAVLALGLPRAAKCRKTLAHCSRALLAPRTDVWVLGAPTLRGTERTLEIRRLLPFSCSLRSPSDKWGRPASPRHTPPVALPGCGVPAFAGTALSAIPRRVFPQKL